MTVFFLISACVPLDIPRPGQPVVVSQGQALVFGRIRMLDVARANLEYSAFRFNPWDQPFFGTGPRMTLELRQLSPPGGAFRYKAYPAPPVEADGVFFWILPAGDYLLLGNPRLFGSKRFNPAESAALARFTVPDSGGTRYVGTLYISVVFDVVDFLRAWGTDEAEYEIRRVRVMDEGEQALARLRERFPVFPEPVAAALMHAE